MNKSFSFKDIFWGLFICSLLVLNKSEAIKISDFEPADQAKLRATLSSNKIVCSSEQCWNYVPGSLRGYPSGIKRAYIDITNFESGEVTHTLYTVDCYHGKLGIGTPDDPVYPSSYGEKIFNYLCKHALRK